MLYFLRKLALTLYECVHLVVRHGLGELHIDLLVFLQQVGDLLHSFPYHLDDGLVRVHLRLLLQISYSIAGGPDYLALVGFLYSGDDFHKSGFSRAVETDDADLGPVEE